MLLLCPLITEQPARSSRLQCLGIRLWSPIPNFTMLTHRALIYGLMGKNNLTLADYSRALSIKSDYDGALIGHGNIYRLSEKRNVVYNDLSQAINLGTTEGRAWFIADWFCSYRANIVNQLMNVVQPYFVSLK